MVLGRPPGNLESGSAGRKDWMAAGGLPVVAASATAAGDGNAWKAGVIVMAGRDDELAACCCCAAGLLLEFLLTAPVSLMLPVLAAAASATTAGPGSAWKAADVPDGVAGVGGGMWLVEKASLAVTREVETEGGGDMSDMWPSRSNHNAEVESE
jgi:hypothetical protein